MFIENDGHNQQELYSSYSTLHPNTQKRLGKSWAPIFYEHVFRQIDEKPFAVLYNSNMGRPNFPVNILLSLELIKHIFDYTDEMLLDQYNFNYQLMYALGESNLGERYLGDRTFYLFRRRIYEYTIQNPDQEDLIFGQFKGLLNHFLEVTGIDTRQQRMDSTLFMSNIKMAGRLALAYDVLHQALKVCPAELLTNNLKEVLDPEFKTNLLYRTRSSQVPGRMQEMLNLSAALLQLVEDKKLAFSPEIALLARFLEEQAFYDRETDSWHSKENKDIPADSLQSAYDPDATFRSKGGKAIKGYTFNLTETCADENPVQLVTDYTTQNSSASDTEMLQERLPEIKENTDIEDLYVDGGYYGEDTEKMSQEQEVNVHYTDMTGKAPDSEKIPLTEFTFDRDLNVLACPKNHPSLKSNFKKKNGMINAHFPLEQCQQCESRENCPIKFQKTSAVLRVNHKSVLAAHARDRTFAEPQRKEAVSKRAAAEGSISAIKRSQGADKLRVRTHPKVQVVTGLKMIGRNIRQIIRYFQGKTRRRTAASAEEVYQVQAVSALPPPSTGVVCTS